MQDQTRKYVARYVEDLHSLVTHGLQPISRQLDEARAREHAEAAQLIGELQLTFQEHERMLAQRMHALGTSPTTGLQDAAAAVAGVAGGIYNHVRSEAVAKSLRDDYTFISHCSISWLMLLTTARALGDHETEELAEQGYRDTARLVMRLDRVMPSLVIQELEQDGFAAQDVSHWAQRLVSDAWTREQVGSAIG